MGHQQQLDCVYNTKIPATIRRWLYIYMQNKRAKVHFRQQKSKSRKVKTGVVQGRVLSPAHSIFSQSSALFKCCLADFSSPPPNIKLIKYADDISIYAYRPVEDDQINGLNIYLSHVLNYIDIQVKTVSTAIYIVPPCTPVAHEHNIRQ